MSGLRRCLLLLLSLLLTAASVLAQRDRDSWLGGSPVEISGQVRLTDGSALPKDVNVSLERFSGGIVDQLKADSSGRFRFANLQRGYYTIIVNAPGFNASRQQVDLQIIQRAYLVVDLTPDKTFTATRPAGPPAVIDARVPLDAQNEFALAEAALKEKNDGRALQHLLKAVHLYPDFYQAQLTLATTYLNANEPDKAEGALQHALLVKPESTSVLFLLGEVYRRQKRYQLAEENLLKGLKIDEPSWQGHFTLGRVYWEMEEIPKSAAQVGRSLQLKSDFAEGHLLAGNILLRVGQPERALVEYEEYLRLAPKGEFVAQTTQLVAKLKASIPAHKP
jgi:tetratricopeptide (TPR) repeat protein